MSKTIAFTHVLPGLVHIGPSPWDHRDTGARLQVQPVKFAVGYIKHERLKNLRIEGRQLRPYRGSRSARRFSRFISLVEHDRPTLAGVA